MRKFDASFLIMHLIAYKYCYIGNKYFHRNTQPFYQVLIWYFCKNKNSEAPWWWMSFIALSLDNMRYQIRYRIICVQNEHTCATDSLSLHVSFLMLNLWCTVVDTQFQEISIQGLISNFPWIIIFINLNCESATVLFLDHLTKNKKYH